MCPVNLDVTVFQGRDPLGKINSEETSRVGALRPLWQAHQPYVIPPAPILHTRHPLGESKMVTRGEELLNKLLLFSLHTKSILVAS